MTGRLTDKHAVVVGASRGMGQAIAETFAEEGAAVTLAARTIGDLETVAENIDGETLAVECDLRETSDVDRVIENAASEFGEIDVVLNSVGTLTRGPLVETSDEDLRYVVDTNLLGTLRLARAGLPKLAETDGTLINISSEAAVRGVPNLPAYSATKGAVNSLTKQLAVEYSGENVTVNAIAPGTTKTSMNEEVRRTDPEWEDQRSQGIPLGRLGTTDDITGVATFLASDEAAYITGEVIAVDGGSTAQ